MKSSSDPSETPPRPVLAPGMKPGDHPDFFRLPPPPGRSRESRIVLDARGRFWNDGVLVDHSGMAAAFATWIRRHPDNGRFILENRYDWTYFTVEDVPFFVRGMRTIDGIPMLTLSDGSEEPVDPSTVMSGSGDALYVRVKQRKYEAKFLPSAQAALVDLIVEGDDGAPVVQVGGSRFSIALRNGQSG